MEPHRSSALLWQVVAVSRLLCYALQFPPKAAVMVPVEALLSVTFHGLFVQQVISPVLATAGVESDSCAVILLLQVTRHSPEALLLAGLLPVIHTAVWNVMAAVIHRLVSCQYLSCMYSLSLLLSTPAAVTGTSCLSVLPLSCASFMSSPCFSQPGALAMGCGWLLEGHCRHG